MQDNNPETHGEPVETTPAPLTETMPEIEAGAFALPEETTQAEPADTAEGLALPEPECSLLYRPG